MSERATSSAAAGHKRPSEDDAAGTAAKKNKPAAQHLSPLILRRGQDVEWTELSSSRVEHARVLADQGSQLVLVDAHGTAFVKAEQGFRERLRHVSWRAYVKEGDFVRIRTQGLYAQGGDWHLALVRKVFRRRCLSKSFLTVEPACLGSTLTLPLSSLCVRGVEMQRDEEARRVMSSDSKNWLFDHDMPPHSFKRSQHHRHARILNPVVADRCKYTSPWGGTSTGAWIVRAPCKLPDTLRMVRQDGGNLMLCRVQDLEIKSESQFQTAFADSSAAPARIPLGVVEIPIKPPKSGWLDVGSNLSLFYSHVAHGDYDLAAKLLRLKMVEIVSGEEWYELCTALTAFACHPLQTQSHDEWHPVARSNHRHKYYYGAEQHTRDMQSLSNSLQQLVTLNLCADAPDDMLKQLDDLRSRINAWRRQPLMWWQARRMQLADETLRPLEARIVDITRKRDDLPIGEPGAQWVVKIDVVANVANFSFVNPYRCGLGGVGCELRYACMVLQYFTSSSCAPSPELRRFKQDLHESWETAVARVAAVPDDADLAALVLRREQEDPTTCCVTQFACSSSDLMVPWNFCEGPVWEPEAEYAGRGVVLPERRGVVMVHNCARRKKQDVADVLAAERRGHYVPTPADLGSTLIITHSSLLYEWQHYLFARDIPAVVFTGCGRRGPATQEALERGDVVLATASALHQWVDVEFFRHANVLRLVLDEVHADTQTTPTFMSDLITSEIPKIWLLARRVTDNLVAMALPLFRVRPFGLRSNWLTDAHSDFRKRPYVHAALGVHNFDDTESSQHHQTVLYRLCRQLFVHRFRPMRSLVIRNHLLTPPAPYSAPHERMLRALYDNYFGPLGQLHMTQYKLGGYKSLLTTAQLACWGIAPAPSLVSTCITRGEFETSASATLAQLTALTNPNSAVEDAKTVCASLSDGSFAPDPQRTCPVCMEVLGLPAEEQAEPEEDAESTGGDVHSLRRSVVVGACGHMLCGVCADMIWHTARTNVATQVNDFGPLVPVNRPCCPTCRDPWDERAPLLSSAAPQISYSRHKGQGVFYRECSLNPADYGVSPLVQALYRFLLDRNNEHKVVVISHSSALTRHLYRNCPTASAKLDGNMPPKARGRALSDFRNPNNNIKVLFATAKLLVGLVFDDTNDFVFTQPVTRSEHAGVKRALRSTLHYNTSDATALRVHSVRIPAIYGPCRLSPFCESWWDGEHYFDSANVDVVPTFPAEACNYIFALNHLFGVHEEPAVSGVLV